MSPDEIAALNARYAIPGELVFRQDDSGLAVVEVTSRGVCASIFLQGGQLTSWVPAGGQPVIWLSPAARFAAGKSIRGGVPVCWPWFGPHAADAAFPAHGFVRTLPWQMVATKSLEEGGVRLWLQLPQSDQPRQLWPHSSQLELRFTIGRTLDIELLTRNTGTASFTIGEALHSYFFVSDVRCITLHGLDGCVYLDKVEQGRRRQSSEPVTISAETDRVYLATTADCVIDDPGLERRIRISKRGSSSTVVWNPWAEKAARLGDMGEDGYLNMLCVESGNAADDVVIIEPGSEHRLWVRYQVETT